MVENLTSMHATMNTENSSSIILIKTPEIMLVYSLIIPTIIMQLVCMVGRIARVLWFTGLSVSLRSEKEFSKQKHECRDGTLK